MDMKHRDKCARIDCNVVRPVGVWDPCFPLPCTQLAVGHYSCLSFLDEGTLPGRPPEQSRSVLNTIEYSEQLLQTKKNLVRLLAMLVVKNLFSIKNIFIKLKL